MADLKLYNFEYWTWTDKEYQRAKVIAFSEKEAESLLREKVHIDPRPYSTSIKNPDGEDSLTLLETKDWPMSPQIVEITEAPEW